MLFRSLAPAREHMGLRERLQVTRDVALGASRGGDQVADAPLALEQGLDQPQPHRLGEHGEAARHELEGVFGERNLSGHGGQETGA